MDGAFVGFSLYFVEFGARGAFVARPRRRPVVLCLSTEGEPAAPARRKRRERVGMPKGVGHRSAWYAPSLVEGSLSAGSGALRQRQDLVVLGIETSCDDTAAAVVRGDGVILGESIAHQHEIHQEWGGVVPNLAMEAHRRAMDGVISTALRNAGLEERELDAVAVTMGPGLEICLRIGFNAAKDICERAQKPFVAVNHLEGHCLMARMLHSDLEYPFMVVLVSGGHCQLLVARGVGDYELIGGTLDDAVGEAFDKTARMLGLRVGGAGGPAVERLAENGDDTAFKFPVAMRQKRDCNFSYAGLKNAVRLAALREGETRAADIAASFQKAAFQHLLERIRRAMNWSSERHGSSVRSVVLCGGVASNLRLRAGLQSLCEELDWRLIIPEPRLCTDNGAMIAWAGIERIRNGMLDDPARLEVVSRWPLSTTLAYPAGTGS